MIRKDQPGASGLSCGIITSYSSPTHFGKHGLPKMTPITAPGPWEVVATGGTEGHQFDADEARRALLILADPAAGIELRALPSAKYKICRGDDIEGQLTAAEDLASEAVYFALNPIPFDLQHRPRAGDALRRRWFLIDFDRVKTESDKNFSATNAEKTATREAMLKADIYLTDLGWPASLRIDSGNGWHLLFRLDLPNDKETHKLLHAVLKRLAAMFDTTAAEVDVKCHNDSRISKLPGCWARKGPDTEERPHRPCRLERAPVEARPVPLHLLQAFVATAETAPDRAESDVWTLTATNEVSSAYGRKALDEESGKVCMAPAGQRNEQLFKSTACLAELVGGNVLGRDEVESAMRFAAERAGLAGKEIEATLRSAFEAGLKNPRGVPEAAAAREKARKASDPPVIYTMPQLLDLEIPPVAWLIPGMLSEGLTLLAGKPKLGKSWMALNLALTIAAGGKALGNTQVSPGCVLYLALEDRLRRVQDRGRKLLGGLVLPVSDRLEIATAWPRADQGGLEHLEAWLKRVGRPALCIIDVWAKFRGTVRAGANQYDADYQQSSDLKSLFDNYGASCIGLHHCKKAAADDALDEISGTLGLAGAADGAMILTRSRGENEGKLFLTGRDIDEKELALAFDPKTCVWSSLGDSKTHGGSKIAAAIMDVYRVAPNSKFFPAEMAERTGLDRDQVKNAMWRMARDGKLQHHNGGKYSWPIETTPENGDGAYEPFPRF